MNMCSYAPSTSWNVLPYCFAWYASSAPLSCRTCAVRSLTSAVLRQADRLGEERRLRLDVRHQVGDSLLLAGRVTLRRRNGVRDEVLDVGAPEVLAVQELLRGGGTVERADRLRDRDRVLVELLRERREVLAAVDARPASPTSRAARAHRAAGRASPRDRRPWLVVEPRCFCFAIAVASEVAGHEHVLVRPVREAVRLRVVALRERVELTLELQHVRRQVVRRAPASGARSPSRRTPPASGCTSSGSRRPSSGRRCRASRVATV